MDVFCAALSFPAQIAFIQDVGQMSLTRFPCRYRFYLPVMQLDSSVSESQCPLMTPESTIKRSNQPLQQLVLLTEEHGGKSEEGEMR